MSFLDDDDFTLWDDYEAEGYFSRHFPHGAPGDIWESNDGPIAVKNMTTDHIANVMRLIGEDDPWYSAFVAELERRKKEMFHAVYPA